MYCYHDLSISGFTVKPKVYGPSLRSAVYRRPSLTPMNCPIWPKTLGSVYGRTPYIMHRKYFNISDQLNNAFIIIFIILTGTIKMMNVWNLSSGHYRIWYLVNSSVLKKWIIFISKRQWGAHDSHTSRNGNRKRTRLDQLELCRSADTPFA